MRWILKSKSIKTIFFNNPFYFEILSIKLTMIYIQCLFFFRINDNLNDNYCSFISVQNNLIQT